ncbi:MAG: PQQ-binding-like beta-propeller repeat protein [Polyangiaceae bacterium]
MKIGTGQGALVLSADKTKTKVVKLRALLIWPICGLAWLPLAPAASGQGTVRSTEARAAMFPAPRFRFDAGAGLSAPAGVAPDGALCVGTVDGYVHSLASDGSYLWSHSVQGAVTRRPLFAGQHWQIATSSNRIYALRPDGTLSWVFKPLSPVVSELAGDASGALYFVAADRFLYGVSARGGVSLRAPFGELKAGPSLGPDGAIWAENQAGTVLRVSGQAVRRLAPGAPAEFQFGDPEVLRDPEGHLWRGQVNGVLEYRSTPQASPVSVTITASPLLVPAWSSAAHYAVLSSRAGLLFAVDPPASAQQR